MRFLGFICWIRGYHRSFFTVTAFNGHAKQICGESFPCGICGERTGNGETRANTLIQWPYEPKHDSSLRGNAPQDV